MDDEEMLPELDSDDLDSDLPPAPEGATHCQDCTILIGPGYVEAEPIPNPAGTGFICWRCYESWQRREDRRLRAERLGQAPPEEHSLRRFRRR